MNKQLQNPEVTKLLYINVDKLKTKRAAIYTRVSSKKNITEESLDTQETMLKMYLDKQPNTFYMKTYTDAGISGTIENRPGFQEMIKDCKDGKIDLIVTKSINRFARNTALTLKYLRELTQLGIDVYFAREDVHSISEDGELLVTMLATFAEAEAESASENQLWRIRKDFMHGIPSPTRLYGYKMVDRKFVIIPEEAEIVKRIFNEYLNGKGVTTIAKELNLEGVPPLKGGQWLPSVIGRMLHNEIYCGDLLLQKTYRLDFRSKKSKLNHGERDQYYSEDDHPAIISKEDFSRVQELAKERFEKVNAVCPKHNSYLYTAKIFCGNCGSKFVRKVKHGIPYWSCRTYQYMGKDTCPTNFIPESIIDAKLKEILHTETLTQELIQEKLEKIIVPDNGIMHVHLTNGSVVVLDWTHKSRKESWTPEMKLKARKQALTRMEVMA